MLVDVLYNNTAFLCHCLSLFCGGFRIQSFRGAEYLVQDTEHFSLQGSQQVTGGSLRTFLQKILPSSQDHWEDCIWTGRGTDQGGNYDLVTVHFWVNPASGLLADNLLSLSSLYWPAHCSWPEPRLNSFFTSACQFHVHLRQKGSNGSYLLFSPVLRSVMRAAHTGDSKTQEELSSGSVTGLGIEGLSHKSFRTRFLEAFRHPHVSSGF